MDKLKNRIYGLLIGGALGDAIGSIAEIMPGVPVHDLEAGRPFGILPGYWQESTATLLALGDALLNNKDVIFKFQENLQQPDRWTTDGIYSNLDPGTLAFIKTGRSRYTGVNAGALVRTPAVALVFFKSYTVLLEESYTCCRFTHQSPVCADVCKLYAAILDGILHGHSKTDVLSAEMYENLILLPEVKDVILGPGRDPVLSLVADDDIVFLLKTVLDCFKKTNNYHQGLDLILKQTDVKLSYAATLYGQLAGAYYGLTDIKKDWIIKLKRPEIIVDFAEKILKESI